MPGLLGKHLADRHRALYDERTQPAQSWFAYDNQLMGENVSRETIPDPDDAAMQWRWRKDLEFKLQTIENIQKKHMEEGTQVPEIISEDKRRIHAWLNLIPDRPPSSVANPSGRDLSVDEKQEQTRVDHRYKQLPPMYEHSEHGWPVPIKGHIPSWWPMARSQGGL